MTSDPAPRSIPVRRVAVVSDYSFATLGGAETAMFEQVRALSASLEVTVLAPRSDRMQQLAEQSGATVIGVPMLARLPGLGLPLVPSTARLRARLRRLLRDRDVQLVHLHSEFGLAAAVTRVAAELGIPVVQTVHTFFWQTSWPVQRLLAALVPAVHRGLTGLRPTTLALDQRQGNSALRNMTLTQARTVQRVISPSAHQADALRQAGLHPVDVIPNTLSTDVGAARVLSRPPAPVRVIWIGRLVPEKRPLAFLRAGLAAIAMLGPGRLQLVVVGDGEQAGAARTLVGDNPDVVLLGRQPHERVLQLLAEAHLCALTSVGWDNQPMTVVEAVSSLRGVIYCDPRLREGLAHCGLLADGTDEARLTALLVQLVEQPQRVVAASEGALTDRTEFSAAVFSARVLACYEAAVRDLG